MAYEEHEKLIKTLHTIKGKFLLSGYSNKLYDGQGWRREAKQIDNKASSRKTKELKNGMPLDELLNLVS